MPTTRDKPAGPVDREPSTLSTGRGHDVALVRDNLLHNVRNAAPLGQSTTPTKPSPLVCKHLPVEPLASKYIESANRTQLDAPNRLVIYKPASLQTNMLGVPKMATQDLLLLKHCIDGQLAKRGICVDQSTADESAEWCYVDQVKDTEDLEDTFEVIKAEDAEY